MGVPMNVKIDGLVCQLTHEPSNSQIRTTPPKDNGGDGSTFSPTDLVGAALASCALTTMALVAGREGLTFLGGSARVEKEMTPPPRRIASLALVITMPAATPEAQRARLEEIAKTCPVARSLHPDVQLPLRFEYA
jgi:uncharacterized OsmC-like protein